MRRICLVLALLAPAAHAETLEEALAAAYAGNPLLLSQRTALEVTDESLPLAQSGWRPTVTVAGYAGRGHYFYNNSDVYESDRDPTSQAVILSQPLYSGGRTVAAIAQARNSVLAGRAQLTAAEQSVLLAAATAYLDVVRDTQLLSLAQANEKVLHGQRDGIAERFKAQQVTRTDLSQAESRASGATSDRVAAEVAAQSSQATYLRVIGHPPDRPAFPRQLPATPPSLDSVLNDAKSANPLVIAANMQVEAARNAVDLVAGELQPTVSINGDVTRNLNANFPGSAVLNKEVLLTLSMPLYEGGAVYARLRAAKLTVSQRLTDAEEAELEAVQSATQAWSALERAAAQLQALREQVKAAQIAFDSILEEANAGRRTVIDMLNAQQDLFTAQGNEARATHDQLAAAYQLRASIGEMTAASLELPVKLHDPGAYFEQADGKWIGWRIDDRPQ
jgi:outer membrane protein